MKQQLKHLAGVVEMNAWLITTTEALAKGLMSEEAATFVANRSGEIVREYLSEERPLPYDAKNDDSFFETVIAQKEQN